MKPIFFKWRSLPVSLAMIAGVLLAAGGVQAAGEKSQKGGLPEVEARVQALEDDTVDFTVVLSDLQERLKAFEDGGGDGGAGGGGGGQTDLVVNCGVGGGGTFSSIAAALAAGDPARPIIITVAGPCLEDVLIRRDDVTLEGTGQVDAAGQFVDELTGSIVVDGSSRVIIQNLAIRNGPGVGVHVTRGSSVTLFDLGIGGHPDAGIEISKSSYAEAINVGVNSAPFGLAIQVRDGSDLDVAVEDAVLLERLVFGGVVVSGHSRAGFGTGLVVGDVSLFSDSLLQVNGTEVMGLVNCSTGHTQNLVVNNGSITGGAGEMCSIE